jgi:ketosteroid isomerase-like protein
MEIEENKAAIRRFLSQEVFFGGSLAVVDEVFAPDVVWRSPGNGDELSSGTDIIKRELRNYQDQYEDHGGEIAILEQIAEGDSVATRYRLVVYEQKYVGVTFSRFADGRIQEYRVVVALEAVLEEVRSAGRGHN